jgi:hypothetical protein
MVSKKAIQRVIETGGGLKVLLNGYGPSETGMISTAKVVVRSTNPYCVGVAIPHSTIYVVDKQLMPLFAGFSGEILHFSWLFWRRKPDKEKVS